jgi:hypothetical protein
MPNVRPNLGRPAIFDGAALAAGIGLRFFCNLPKCRCRSAIRKRKLGDALAVSDVPVRDKNVRLVDFSNSEREFASDFSSIF